MERILRTPRAHRTDSPGCIRSRPPFPFPAHSSFSASILQPSSSLVALLAELLKLEPATTTPIYTYISRGWRERDRLGARVHIPGGRRAENNKARLSSGTALPPLQLPPLSLSPFYSLSRSFHFGLRAASARSSFNLDPTYALQANVRPYVRPCARRTSYLFYFIVSRSHPQAWVNIFLRDPSPTVFLLSIAGSYHPYQPHRGCFSFVIVVSATQRSSPPLVTHPVWPYLVQPALLISWTRGLANATRRRTCNFEVRGGELWKIATGN